MFKIGICVEYLIPFEILFCSRYLQTFTNLGWYTIHTRREQILLL